MCILDRYILKSMLAILLSCIFIFIFLYIIIDVLSHLEDILRQRVNLFLLTQYYLSYLPIIFIQVTPFACLLSTLYTFGKLNRDNEIIAMRSSGLSIFQITKTAIILGLIISLFVSWINNRFIPQALSLNQKVKEQIEEGTKKGKPKKPEVINNLSMYGLKNRLFFVNKFNLATNTMEGIVILEHDEHQDITKKIVANKGVYVDNLWKFYQCITYNFDQNGQIVQEPQYLEEEIMAIHETPNDFLSQRQRPDFMTTAQLEDYIWKLSKSGASTVIRNLKIDLYQRFASPFTNLMIVLLGVPFSLLIRRRSTGLASIGIAIMVAFLYYIFDAVSIALGKGGFLTPILSVSLSHLLVLLTAIYMIKTQP